MRKVPESVWTNPDLTLENFSEKVKSIAGFSFRFRRLKDQVQRGLSREEAFEEIKQKQRIAAGDQNKQEVLN